MVCAPSEDTVQPGHLPSLIRVFTVCMKKAWILDHPLSAYEDFYQTGRMPRLIESSLGSHVISLVLSCCGCIRSCTCTSSGTMSVCMCCLSKQQRLWQDCEDEQSCPSFCCLPMWNVPFLTWAGSIIFYAQIIYEPPHDKTNNMTVRPAKTQISLGIHPVWSESSLCTQWVAKDPSFLHADSEDSDQTGRMPRLIWVFARRTVTLLVLPWGDSYLKMYDYLLFIEWWFCVTLCILWSWCSNFFIIFFT